VPRFALVKGFLFGDRDFFGGNMMFATLFGPIHGSL
jgi:hypothetical protein